MLKGLANAHLLVTGGAGFMGSAFIRNLLRDEGFGGRVLNLDLLTYAAHLGNLSPFEEDPRYRFVQGDIRDQKGLERLRDEEGIDAIIHFAAQTHVDRSIHDPSVFVETNVFGTFQLLEFVRIHPEIHFHHISTDEVYGSLGEKGLFTETSPYRPSSPYSASKAASDHFVRAYGTTYDLSLTLSHACNNYGPHQFPEKFIPLMILNCLKKKPLPLYGKGTNRREWLYVDDHSRAVKRILTHGKNQEAYNVGSGEEWTNLDLLYLIIEEVATFTGEDPGVYQNLMTFVPDRPGHDFRYGLKRSKIEALGWRPKTCLKEGIRSAIACSASSLTGELR